MYKRILTLGAVRETFFLWGPRQVGKSSLLKTEFPDALFIDLLQSDVFAKYQARPHLLREELLNAPKSRWTIIDEIQKVPALLDEVHWLIANRKLHFGLCGSSARKVKRGHANLLGGRALRFELTGLSAYELKSEFDLIKTLNVGYLPTMLAAAAPRDHKAYKDKLRAYCGDYLKEEIAAEGLVRNLPSFSRFLEAAVLSDTEAVNFATIARDTGVSAPTIKNYFEILEDTMIGKFLPVYRKRPKRRLETSPKFYFFDVGVVSQLGRRGVVEPRSELFGKAFENWVHHELRAYQAYRNQDLELSFWRTSSQIEVDFVVSENNKILWAIEAKGSERLQSDHFKGLREMAKDYPTIKRRTVVCLEATSRTTEDGIEVLPYQMFVDQLWGGALV